MADIFNEIDEELRKDRATEWWKQYGVYVVIGVGTVIAAVAGYTWYEQNRVATAQAEAQQIAEAIDLFDAQDTAGATSALATVASETGSAGTSLLARMTAAGGLAQTGDHAGAAALYDEIAADSTVDALYRDLAEVFAVLHHGQGGSDAKALLSRLEPQTTDTAVWRYTARMVAASLALSAGDRAGAETYLQSIADDDGAPSSARGQAAEILRAFEG